MIESSQGSTGIDLCFGYRAFGFFLLSNRPLPGLIRSSDSQLPAISVLCGLYPDDFDAERYSELWYRSPRQEQSGESALVIRQAPGSSPGADGDFWLQYVDGTAFLITDNASRIWVNWPDWSSIEEACTYLLGPVMAMVAQFRGQTCLHGSAVVIQDRIVAFLGPQGAGKSTTATAFARAGYKVASDDLILLLENQNGFAVDSSYPILRLWPASVSMLFGHEDALPPISRNWDKRGFDLSQNENAFQQEPLPLGVLYVLGRRSAVDAPRMLPLSGAPALMSLLSNCWAHYAEKASILAAQLHVLTRLSRSVPIRNLVVHEDPRLLPALLELVTTDLQHIQAKRT